MKRRRNNRKTKLSKAASKNNSSITHIVFRLAIGFIAVCVLMILIYSLVSKKNSVRCANSISCTKSLKLKVENNSVGTFNNRRVIPPEVHLSGDKTKPVVLGADTSSEEKHIYVDLTTQKLYAYEGKNLFMQTYISSGKWNRTPTGDFTIWVKLRSTRMTGGSGDDYYDLPNVPYVMFFENKEVARSTGFSLHGTYWHNNFGHPMSHGCVNMRITDAEKLYNWANPVAEGSTTYADNENKGTTITIYGEAPL